MLRRLFLKLSQTTVNIVHIAVTCALKIMEILNVSSQPKSPKFPQPRKLVYQPGTKSISNQSTNDNLYEALANRIEREKSVALWSYRKDENRVTVKIAFIDSDNTLDVRIDVLNIPKLQEAIQTIDDYLLRHRMGN